MSGNLWLLIPVLLPIVMGIIMSLLRVKSIKVTQSLVVGTVLVNFAALIYALNFGSQLTVWQVTESLAISFNIDGLGLIFVILVSVIWVLAVIFAIEYMSHEVNIIRFYIFYLMTLGSMIGIGASANIFTFYMFYELMTLMTYPLVINEMSDRAKRAGNMYLAYSLIGAAFTLIALMVVNSVAASNDFIMGGTLSQLVTNENRGLLLIVYFVAVIGYGAKAGLYPLHAWLPKAHPVAPAPASAILSGVITKAGVLGIIRLTYYVFGVELVMNSWAHVTLLVLTLFTIFLGSLLAFRAKELKIRLAYSSISQVSYVLFGVLLLETNAFIGGVLQVLSHAMIKNLLFFAVGAIMYMTGKTNVDQIRGEGKNMPITMWAFTIGSLALIGIPPFSGFVSKLYIALGSLQTGNEVLGMIGISVLIISSMLTAGYLVPIIIKAFFPRSDFNYNTLEKFEAKPLFTVPLIILSLGIVVLGVYPQPVINFIASISQTIM